MTTTPADRVPVPEPGPAGHDLADPAYFLNRELTWLNFNYRVLDEAADRRNPLLERLKFVAIVSSNLNEFFMKRIGGLKQQVGAGVSTRTPDGRSPSEQIAECCALVRRLESKKLAVLEALRTELEEKGITVRSASQLDPTERNWLREYFFENIYPLVTPQATDPAHPFPFISNLSLNLLVTLRYDDLETSLARVKVPIGAGISRFIRLPDRNTYVPLETVMADNLDLLFPGMEVVSCSFFRVTRNSNTETAEERADDLLALIEAELRERKFAPIVRLEVSSGMDSQHLGILAAELGLDAVDDVFESVGYLGLRDFMEIATDPRLQGEGLRDEPHYPMEHPVLVSDRNIFHILRDQGSVLLHHPYQSFATSVERFLLEASRDPKVRAIKMCLYRTSSESKAIDYLIDAAKNGKQVTVVVEIKARFDEAANIRWANRLEEAGIHVTYGVVGLKTHCKVILVVRQDYNGLRRYAHVGTGNYHAGTARLYTDFGLLTADHQIGQDLTELLNYLTTGYKPKRRYQKILPSPKMGRQALLQKIEREVEHARAGRGGAIQFKMNALEDPEITRALYAASQAGVAVDLIVRDSCRLRPGVPGLSDNVRVISIVGRFLEHARVYYFRNGGGEDDEYYIGSADCMKRNLDSRVEVFVPVEQAAHKKELREVLDRQLADRRGAWEMRGDGSYARRMPTVPEEEIGVQRALVDLYDRRLKESKRLKKRRIRGFDRRFGS
ncbi:MAG: polyphosphate kinase 1 [Planctomycetes bacterium]|nr:polyphosphate kinase 1 [Planctomycetota bacterium]